MEIHSDYDSLYHSTFIKHVAAMLGMQEDHILARMGMHAQTISHQTNKLFAACWSNGSHADI
jgi:hypothetical protein